jgi:signal transduction histidine kinase
MMGALVVAPPLLAVALSGARGGEWAGARPGGARAGALEATALVALLVGTNALVFGARANGNASTIREAYLVFPLLVWAGIRFGAPGAAFANLIVSSIAIVGTALKRGPFQMPSLASGLLHLQGFMVVVVATSLVLGAASQERRQAIGLRNSLISLASHELRTPLTSLQLRIQLLGREVRAAGTSPDRLARDVAGAEDQAKRLVRMLDDLLDISRIMSGRLRLDLEDVDLSALIREVVDRCPEPQRALVVLREGGEPVIGRWDRTRMDQIVSNLLSNALKYGADKPVEIRVGQHGGRALIEVQDHGVGIAAADLPRIFERFERAAGKGVTGFGLGLWIVRQIVDAFGGTISVESHVGGGSVFTVELPLEPHDLNASGSARYVPA